MSKCNRASHWDRGIIAKGEELIGQRFGVLTVIAATADRSVTPGGSRAAQVLTRCDCGAERFARITDLNGGSVRSCGGDVHKTIPAQAKRWEVRGKRGTYAIKAVGTDLVKIGAARDFKARMWKMQPFCPVELRMVASSESDIEKRLHVLLKPHRAHGEWFHANEKVMSVIADLMTPANLSVFEEAQTARAGSKEGSKHRCKRCGDLGHHAKTCARPLGE